MTNHIGAAFVALWFCVGWPGLCFLAGLVIGRHGLKHAITLALFRIAGNGGFDNAQ